MMLAFLADRRAKALNSSFQDSFVGHLAKKTPSQHVLRNTFDENVRVVEKEKIGFRQMLMLRHDMV